MVPFLPPPSHVQRRINAHRRWLESGGTDGHRIGTKDILHLDGLNLDGVDLSLGLLGFSTFIGASLRGAFLIGTSLFSTDFNECDLTGAHLNGADLQGALLFNARLHRADFDDSNAERAFWTRSENNADHKASLTRVRTLFQARSHWSETDWKAYRKKENEESKVQRLRADECRQQKDQELFALWHRLKKGRIASPQPIL